MNKTEFIKRMSERMSLPPKVVSCFLEIFKEELATVLKENDRLIIQDFGSYHLWKRTERVGRNPKTGEKCIIPSSTSIKFRPGKSLLADLNESKS